jgi:hypothetical protein
MSLHSLLRPAFIGMIYLNLELDSIETRSGPIWLEKVTAADRAHADLLGKVFMLALVSVFSNVDLRISVVCVYHCIALPFKP